MDSKRVEATARFPDAAKRAALEAAHMAGVELNSEPELIRVGERAVFRLRPDVIARVARPGGQGGAAREVSIARWLRSEALDVDEPLVGDQPVIAVGLAVTFWRVIDGQWTVPADLARVLRSLHRLAEPAGFRLGLLDPFERLLTRINSAPAFSPSERVWLKSHMDRLRVQVNQLQFDRPTAVIHGDANIGNVLKTMEGRVVLFDLDGVCIGPPEWDLALTALYRELGWHTDAEYADFCQEYGFDVTSWAGYPVFRDVRLLRMTCWLAQKAQDGPEIDAELRRRLADLADPSRPKAWKPY